MMGRLVDLAICRIAAMLATTVAIVGIPALCAMLPLWVSANAAGNIDNIVALLLGLIILRAQGIGERALQAKLDGLVRVSDAPDSLVGIERP